MASLKTSCYHHEKVNQRLYTRFSTLDIDRLAENDIPRDVIVAIKEDNHAAFRVQCAFACIQWRSIVSKKYCSILHECGAFEILLALAKLRKPSDSTVEFDITTLIYNLLFWGSVPGDKLEEFLKLFVNEYGHSTDELAEIIDDTEFVTRTYGGKTAIFGRGANYYDTTDIYEMFERLFPGRGLFPNPKGSWTDPRDGKIYETIRIHDAEFVKVPVGEQRTQKEIEELLVSQRDKILPEGWRFPSLREMERLFDFHLTAKELDDLVRSGRFGRVLNKKNFGAIIFPVSSAFIHKEPQLYGVICQRDGELSAMFSDSLYPLINEDYDGTKEINPEYCKMSIFICRNMA